MTVIRLNGLNLSAQVQAAIAAARSAAKDAADFVRAELFDLSVSTALSAGTATVAATSAETDRIAAQAARIAAEAARDLASQIAIGDADATMAAAVLDKLSAVYAALTGSFVAMGADPAAYVASLPSGQPYTFVVLDPEVGPTDVLMGVTD